MTDVLPEINADAIVSLRPVNKDNLRDVMRLQVAPTQESFVAPNPVSLSQAHFEKNAWYRAICADDTPVGFMMLYDDPVTPKYFLWRLMVDQRYQRMGFGRRALDVLVDYVKTRPGATELLVSYVEGDGTPGPFYQRYGFEHTGEVLEGELVMRLPLPSDSPTATADEPRPLTHVVLFRLKDRGPEAVESAAAVLRSLDGVVPTLRGIEVGVNVVPSARAYDIALVTRFDSLADMETYQIHPRHQEVSAFIRDVSDAIVAVDYH